ncbi:hypothetical protein [Streptomyces aureus]|uniref:hypothetical protein n=1 Tax=Streptomyces aureus TaxID=193461 RepID=UPI0036370EC0
MVNTGSGRSGGGPASRLNTLLGAARPYKAAAVDELRTRALESRHCRAHHDPGGPIRAAPVNVLAAAGRRRALNAAARPGGSRSSTATPSLIVAVVESHSS